MLTSTEQYTRRAKRRFGAKTTHVQQLDRQLDRDLETLAASKTAWARLPLEWKIAMLRALQRNIYALAPQWVQAAASAKGLAPGSPLAGEEWISGPWAVLYAINRYIRTLTSISRAGRVRLPAIHVGPGGRSVLSVFPHDAYDRMLLSGVRAEVWMRGGVQPSQVRAGAFYEQASPEGRVVLVLGAGNIASIAPLDVLYKMISEGAVCMLKMNPVNAYLGPLLERVFEPFVEMGFLRFAYGGSDVGMYLSGHEAIDEIHLTGSETTHNAIAFGSGAGKPITSELGNVSPTIVLPGPWTQRDLQFQAENIATQKAHNAGFNCVASQVLVLPKEWEHTQALQERIAAVFAGMEQRPEYYPGAAQRRASLAGEQSPARTMLAVDPRDTHNPALTTEAFCGVLFTLELPGAIEDYVRDAVALANDRLHGTLGANVIVHPETMRSHKALVNEAIAALRYGCIGVNAWTGVGYFITETPWGAYPGHTREEVGSGIGVVHNSYLLEQTEKSVVYAPFAPFPRGLRTGEYALLPKPPWFVTNARAAEIGKALCDFEVARSPAKALAVASLALRA